MQALKHADVRFIVAPYEADAQMAYLAINGEVDVVITEDSDLLPYGCPAVLFKMDKTGEGEEVLLADLPRNRDITFTGWEHHLFLEVCWQGWW
jgi:exonuclease-1